MLGPKAQEVLTPWLNRDATSYLFSPKEVYEFCRMERQKAENSGRRKQRRKKVRRGTRLPRDRYDDETYCQAVERACTRAKVPKWTPGRLRHNSGTQVRSKFGAEAAQLVLGHQNLSTTEIYAEKDMARYRDIIREIG